MMRPFWNSIEYHVQTVSDRLNDFIRYANDKEKKIRAEMDDLSMGSNVLFLWNLAITIYLIWSRKK